MAKHAGNLKYEGDTSSEYPDVLDSLEPAAEGLAIVEDEDALEVDPQDIESLGRHGVAVPEVDADKGGKKKKKELPRYMRKSRRMRKILIVVAVLLVLLIGALAYLSMQLLEESKQLADEQAQEQQAVEDVEKIQEDVSQDATTEAVKKTSAPNLAELMGLNLDQTLEALQRGATVTSTKSLEAPAADDAAEGDSEDASGEAAESEDVGPIKTRVTVALTEEPVDVRTGTPTVYLGLDADGLVIEAGYSASAAALGYGAYSFIDAVKNNYIVERTLQEAGIAVSEGTVQLPEDRSEYTTYAEDGVTLSKEYCPFSGSIEIDGVAYEWSAVLSYDYSLTNAGGSTNLSDTIRIIYVYLTDPVV